MLVLLRFFFVNGELIFFIRGQITPPPPDDLYIVVFIIYKIINCFCILFNDVFGSIAKSVKYGAWCMFLIYCFFLLFVLPYENNLFFSFFFFNGEFNSHLLFLLVSVFFFGLISSFFFFKT